MSRPILPSRARVSGLRCAHAVKMQCPQVEMASMRAAEDRQDGWNDEWSDVDDRGMPMTGEVHHATRRFSDSIRFSRSMARLLACSLSLYLSHSLVVVCAGPRKGNQSMIHTKRLSPSGAAFCLLPSAFCLLPSTFNLLPSAFCCCLLPAPLRLPAPHRPAHTQPAAHTPRPQPPARLPAHPPGPPPPPPQTHTHLHLDITATHVLAERWRGRRRRRRRRRRIRHSWSA